VTLQATRHELLPSTGEGRPASFDLNRALILLYVMLTGHSAGQHPAAEQPCRSKAADQVELLSRLQMRAGCAAIAVH
jgi:hypothetical protein